MGIASVRFNVIEGSSFEKWGELLSVGRRVRLPGGSRPAYSEQNVGYKEIGYNEGFPETARRRCDFGGANDLTLIFLSVSNRKAVKDETSRFVYIRSKRCVLCNISPDRCVWTRAG